MRAVETQKCNLSSDPLAKSLGCAIESGPLNYGHNYTHLAAAK